MMSKPNTHGGSRPKTRADDKRGGARVGTGRPPKRASLFNEATVGLWETYEGHAVMHSHGSLARIEIVKRGTVKFHMPDGKTIYTLILN